MTGDQIIGMDKEDAIFLLEKHNIPFRITAEDGQFFFGTCDYQPERFNLVINNGQISLVDFG